MNRRDISNNVANHRPLNIVSATDRFNIRKFDMDIESTISEFEEDDNEIVGYLRNNLLAKLEACQKAFNNAEDDERYRNSYCRDIYGIPTVLGFNKELLSCKKPCIAVYDARKLHCVFLGLLVGKNPEYIEVMLKEYLEYLSIDIRDYFMFIYHHIDNNIYNKGFSAKELIDRISNSYLTISNQAKEKGLSVIEYVRLFLQRCSAEVFQDTISRLDRYCSYNARKGYNYLVQSYGIDTLIVAGSSPNMFINLRINWFGKVYEVVADTNPITQFNKNYNKVYLQREVMNVC